MGTYPPRECGIATFTRDLTRALGRKLGPAVKARIIALNHNSANICNYPKEVAFQISDSRVEDYISVAEEINGMPHVKLVNIQHEFGIFGGPYGSHLLRFLDAVKKPVIVTFHTVLPDPCEELRDVVRSIAESSSCIVVMAKKAIDILKKDYGIKASIEFIPHGIPTVPFSSSEEKKAKIGFKGRIVLSSFGLMSSNKGYESVIEGLPEVIKKFPNLMYLIIGQTHPVVRKHEGEKYRTFLEKRIKKLGLQENVKFYNKYLRLGEIIKYLQATDIYICPSVNPNQIVSGTLSYAMGCGRAVISTPFIHAKEAVAPERGMLGDFNSPKSFADAITKMLSDPKMKRSMEINSYFYTRGMTWPNVALSYAGLFRRHAGIEKSHENAVPKVKFSHISRLTDSFGVIQFANNIKPDIESGYTLDDNARALIACCMHQENFKDGSKLGLIRTYLDFIIHVQQPDGRMYNYVGKDRNVDLERWSEDPHARALWALGLLASSSSVPEELREEAGQAFLKGIVHAKAMRSPRAAAFAILGLYFFNAARPSDENTGRIRELADFLAGVYQDYSTKKWKWFEKYLTYSNSKLPESLFYAYLATKDRRYMEIARQSLDFLMDTTFENGMLLPVGNNGWYSRNGRKAAHDQQPIDAASMVQTLMLAWDVTKDALYRKKARIAFNWFLGNNTLRQTVYDETTGGCHDGIGESAININQGAESTIEYLIARMALR